MAKRPNWYSEHPPACTCVDCDQRRRAKRRTPFAVGRSGCLLWLVGALLALAIIGGAV